MGFRSLGFRSFGSGVLGFGGNKKKKQEKEKQKKKRKREKEKKKENKRTTICSTSANFDFGQFRLRPISTANLTSASWPKSNCPKSNWPKSSILELERPQPQVVAVDMSAEVERLRALVEQLTKEKEDARPQVDRQGPKRQKDLQSAIVVGQLPEVARISQLLSTAAQEWQQIFQEQAPAMPSAVANMVR